MDKTLLFIVNPRAGKTKSSAPLFDAVATFGKAGYLVKVALTQAAGDAARFAAGVTARLLHPAQRFF